MRLHTVEVVSMPGQKGRCRAGRKNQSSRRLMGSDEIMVDDSLAWVSPSAIEVDTQESTFGQSSVGSMFIIGWLQIFAQDTSLNLTHDVIRIDEPPNHRIIITALEIIQSLFRLDSTYVPRRGFSPSGALLSSGYLLKKMPSTSKQASPL